MPTLDEDCMKIPYSVNYSGYIPLLRRVLLLVKANILPLSQLGPYICFVMQADFDPRHKHYRIILRDDQVIAKELGVSPTTIYRHRKALIKSGLLTEEDGLTKITNFRIYEQEAVKRIASIPHINPEDLFLTPEEDFDNFEDFIANLKQK